MVQRLREKAEDGLHGSFIFVCSTVGRDEKKTWNGHTWKNSVTNRKEGRKKHIEANWSNLGRL